MLGAELARVDTSETPPEKMPAGDEVSQISLSHEMGFKKK